MSAQEINQLRATILKGLNESAQNLLRTKIRNNRSMAISRDNQVVVIPARKLYR